MYTTYIACASALIVPHKHIAYTCIFNVYIIKWPQSTSSICPVWHDVHDAVPARWPLPPPSRVRVQSANDGFVNMVMTLYQREVRACDAIMILFMRIALWGASTRNYRFRAHARLAHRADYSMCTASGSGLKVCGRSEERTRTTGTDKHVRQPQIGCAHNAKVPSNPQSIWRLNTIECVRLRRVFAQHSSHRTWLADWSVSIRIMVCLYNSSINRSPVWNIEDVYFRNHFIFRK